eukprot:6193053-Pleurochrysis_carterae.AAC.3
MSNLAVPRSRSTTCKALEQRVEGAEESKRALKTGVFHFFQTRSALPPRAQRLQSLELASFARAHAAALLRSGQGNLIRIPEIACCETNS